ncbi:hypothetical protein T492DRAFT_578270, partial [Pavlovales sp. CCMP2436]
WLILAVATAFELASSILLKYGAGFVNVVPSVAGSVLYAASFCTFNWSLRFLDISVAYAVWSALVIATLAALGGVLFGEKMSALKV